MRRKKGIEKMGEGRRKGEGERERKGGEKRNS